MFVVKPLGLFNFVDHEADLKICQNCSAGAQVSDRNKPLKYLATLCLFTRVQGSEDPVWQRLEVETAYWPLVQRRTMFEIIFVDEHPWETII